MAMWPLLVVTYLSVSAMAAVEASELTCFFPGKVTKALFGGRCLQYQLMYEGTCRSYFRLQSSGLLCLLEADVFDTARVDPHDVTCPSTEESDCVRYRRFCGGGGHQGHRPGFYQNRVSYSPCGPSGCPTTSLYGPPPPPSPCGYSGCAKTSLTSPAGLYGLPPTPSRDNYPRCGISGCARSTGAVYGPPTNTLDSYRRCPAGTCKVGGQCVVLGQGHWDRTYGNSDDVCDVSPGRNTDVKTVLLRGFHNVMQTVLRTLQQKVDYKNRFLRA